MRWGPRLVAATLALAAPGARAFAVLGYVPDYRADIIDWPSVVTLTTHVIVMSLEPKADGGVEGLNRLEAVLRPGSRLQAALAAAETDAAKVLVSLGGAGRSQHFAKLTESKKARKRLAKAMTKLFQEHPILAGVDLDWEAPTSVQHWRDLGKLAQDLRTALAERQGAASQDTPLLTMAYHPGSGSVASFSSLRARKSEKAFVDLFDFCHAMAYIHFDNDGRHSTPTMDQSAVDEWLKFGLPPGRLTLGVPFFGVARKTGEAVSYSDLLRREPSLREQTHVDESKSGVYFVNKVSMAQKVQHAGRLALGGVMVWELGQDRQGSAGLLGQVSSSAEEVRNSWHYRLSWLPFGENHLILVLSTLSGLYYLREVLIGQPPGHALCKPHAEELAAEATVPAPVQVTPTATAAAAATAEGEGS